MSLLATRIVHWCGRNVLEEFVRDDDVVPPWERTPQKLLSFASDLINHMEEARLEGGRLNHNSFGKSRRKYTTHHAREVLTMLQYVSVLLCKSFPVNFLLFTMLASCSFGLVRAVKVRVTDEKGVTDLHCG